jgi:two-component system NtrC family sensor kinase
MRSERRSAIRLLQLMMVASIVLPVSLFVFAAWLNYRTVHAVADERIERSLDILHEHALKVFQTVELAITAVNEGVNDRPDRDIRASQEQMNGLLRRLVNALPQIQGIIVIDRKGHLLASSAPAPMPDTLDFTDRSYFKAQRDQDVGTFVSEVLVPRFGNLADLFDLARRRPSEDGSFNGVTAISLRPAYFEEFYSRIGRSAGSLYALTRADGVFLARYPGRLDQARNLDANSSLLREIAKGFDDGIYTVRSQVDGIERRIGYRKLIGFPVYVIAGTTTAAIRDEWLATMATHLVFGVPATVLLFAIIGIALQRTRRLHVEAEAREAAEAALRQSQRLEAIGQLTGGVAHDFNNLLMIVSGSVQRLRNDLSDGRHVKLLDMITTATRRGESLTRQLLAFSRRQMHTPAVIDLTRRLPELKDMLGRSLRGDIETEVVVPRESCAVKVDPSEFELALLNLAVNARDAMPNGGTLTITVRPATLRGHETEEHLRGEFVAICVADTGTGIPADLLAHVFEPFFTTKEVGKGTGLGLSQVYGFARQSGGAVSIDSAPGRGTAITLHLPRTHEVAEVVAVPAPTSAVVQHSGNVLLVEDNAEVAEVCKSYFEQLGYAVRRAAGVQEALESLENDGAIDLVFSDILMPGVMNGLELAKAVRDRFPQIPVLLNTGFSSSAQEAVQQGFVVLQKPFDFVTLEESLREVLRGRQDLPRSQPAPG